MNYLLSAVDGVLNYLLASVDEVLMNFLLSAVDVGVDELPAISVDV